MIILISGKLVKIKLSVIPNLKSNCWLPVFCPHSVYCQTRYNAKIWLNRWWRFNEVILYILFKGSVYPSWSTAINQLSLLTIPYLQNIIVYVSLIIIVLSCSFWNTTCSKTLTQWWLPIRHHQSNFLKPS